MKQAKSKTYWFVPVLDAAELLPFAAKRGGKVRDMLIAQDKCRESLGKFIVLLEKALGEKMVYIGCDIIGEKYYERYLFEKQGFFEIMMEAPVAMNAHFVDEARAKSFANALKKALKQTLPSNPIARMFIDNIKHASEGSDSLSVDKWTKIKGIRNL